MRSLQRPVVLGPTITSEIRNFIFGKTDWKCSHRWLSFHPIQKPNYWVIKDNFDNPGVPFTPLAEDQLERYLKAFSALTNNPLGDATGGIICIDGQNETISHHAVMADTVYTTLRKMFGLTAIVTLNGDAEILPEYQAKKYLTTLPKNTKTLKIWLDNPKGLEEFYKYHLEGSPKLGELKKYWYKRFCPAADKALQAYDQLACVLHNRSYDLFLERDEENDEFVPTTIWGRETDADRKQRLQSPANKKLHQVIVDYQLREAALAGV
jgi:hypothetical protein